MISVIVPSRVGEELECIKSIEKQTYKNLEIIVEYDYHERGASAARNRGAKKAQGEYLLFCDNDVILETDAIESMYRAIKDTDFAWVFGMIKIGEAVLNEDRQQLDYTLKGVEFIKQFRCIGTTSLIKRTAKPIFDESILRHNDWDLWVEMSLRGQRGYFLKKLILTTKDRPMGQGISTGLHGTSNRWEKNLYAKYKYKI